MWCKKLSFLEHVVSKLNHSRTDHGTLMLVSNKILYALRCRTLVHNINIVYSLLRKWSSARTCFSAVSDMQVLRGRLDVAASARAFWMVACSTVCKFVANPSAAQTRMKADEQPQSETNMFLKRHLDVTKTYKEVVLHCGLLQDNQFSCSNKFSI